MIRAIKKPMHCNSSNKQTHATGNSSNKEIHAKGNSSNKETNALVLGTIILETCNLSKVSWPNLKKEKCYPKKCIDLEHIPE